MMIPELNKTYNYFDDGKISESRKYSVVITEIVPFDEIDKQTLLYWKNEVHECYWLYAKETDYFIKGDLQLAHKIEKIIFVRTINNANGLVVTINDANGWFSLGLWAGRLDVDGSLDALLNEV